MSRPRSARGSSPPRRAPRSSTSLARPARPSVINYTTEDLKVRAKELSGGGVDVVVDPVGGPLAEPALRASGWNGRFLVIGFAGGGIPKLPANLVLLNNRTLIGVDWGAWTGRDPSGQHELLDEILAAVGDGPAPPAGAAPGDASTTRARCSRPCSTVSWSARRSWCPDASAPAPARLPRPRTRRRSGPRSRARRPWCRRPRRSARPAGSCRAFMSPQAPAPSAATAPTATP